jgi:acetyl esterase/lipase
MTVAITPPVRKKSRLFRIFVWVLSVIIFLAILIYVAFRVSPWPSVLLIRRSFTKEGASANEKLAKYVPDGIASKLDFQYDSSYSKAKLDLYYPQYPINTNPKYPLIIWVHGGGFIAGHKEELANYCKILASKGFIVASADYSIAPETHYPVPVSQINTAIAFLVKGTEFNIDTSKIILAGDSGGAHIVAQLANIFTNQEYAAMLGMAPSVDPANLKGVILHCGPYNTALVDFDGDYGWFLKTVLWSYIGNKNFKNDPKYKGFSVSNFVTSNFPRTFISVGNKDALSLHSHDLASKLSSKGVIVDSLFFPDNYSPDLPHEYQFNLDNEAGKLALQRTVKFLSNCIDETR